MSLIGSIAGTFVFLFLLTSIFKQYHDSLSTIPGPRLASWTRLWWVKTLYTRKTAEELLKVDGKYGPVVRISPHSILISDPKIIWRVLAAGSKYTRGPWFDSLRLDPRTTNVVSERDPKRHQELRNILAAGLAGNDKVDIEATVNEHIRHWIRLLDAQLVSAEGSPVVLNLSQSLPFLALDIVSDLCLGESFNCIQNEKDQYGFLQALETGVIALQYLSVLLELKSFLFWLGRFSVIRSYLFPNKKNPTGIGRVMMVIQKAVERKLAKGKKEGSKTDMLGSFMSRGLTHEQADTELIVVLTGGLASTSYAAQGIIRSIVANPVACRKLQEEIDNTLAEKKIGSSEIIKDSMLTNMPYLQACISEGLRVYPPVFQLRERQVPPEGDVIQGYHIPGGTFVGINSIACQFNPVFGANVEAFCPERWLISDETQLKKMSRNLELVFGYGASKCLGVNMAHIELNKIVFELFRKYNISFNNPDQPWKAHVDFVLSDFCVKIERREGQVSTNVCKMG